jgi:hypothetical protein
MDADHPKEPERTIRSISVADALRVAVPAWIVARVLIGIAWLAARAAVDRDWVHDRLARRTLDQGLLAWDGAFYADIAHHGYGALSESALRFFPATALLGRGVGWLGPGSRLGVVVVANLAALGAGAALARLAAHEGLLPEQSRAAVWLFTLAPAGFVMVLGYAESTFLVAAIAVFLLVRTNRFGAAIPIAMLAGATRPGAFVLAVPIAVEAVRTRRGAGVGNQALQCGAVLAPFGGAALYLWWVGHRYGDALLPYRVQTRANLKGSFTNPITSISRAVEGLVDGSRVGSGLHVLWMVVVVALVVVCFRRLPVSYGLYAAATIASAVTSSNLDSFERYALGAFPIFLAAAMLLARRPRFTWPVIGASAAALTGYATLAFVHAYVP